MNFCQDCQFFALSESGRKEHGTCRHPKAIPELEASRFIAPEFNEPVYKYATIVRKYGPCNPDAQLFKAKVLEAAE